MQAQTPAEGIMLTHKFNDAFSYNVECSCGNSDDSVNIFIEKDEDLDEFIVTFSTKQKTHWWKQVAEWDVYKIDNPWLYSIANSVKELINGFTHRLKITRDVWFKGYVEYQSCTIISKQTALNLSEAIKDAIGKLEDRDQK